MTWRHLPAHLLTAVRVPLAALLWLRPGDPVFFLGVLAAGGVSDVLDGVFARMLDADQRGDPRHIGSWLDPVCDKIFALSSIIAATVSFEPPIVLVALLLFREALQLPLLLVYLTSWLPRGRHADLAAVPAGKLTTVLQFGALVCIVLRSPLLYVMAPAVALSGTVAVAVFLRRASVALGEPATGRALGERPAPR